MSGAREEVSGPVGLPGLLRSLLTAWKPQPDGPGWAPWAWTALLNTVVALALTLWVPASGGLAANLLASHAIGGCIHALFWSIGHGLHFDMFELPVAARVAYVVSVVLAGSWLGYGLASWWWLGDWNALVEHMTRASGLLTLMPVSWAIATIALFALVSRRRARQLEHERERSARVTAERAAVSARLQLLNAQIEPHFLYNTLASVAALIPAEAAGAHRLVDALTAYLRVSSRNLARPLVSLDEELDSVRGYLDVMRIRLGDRLRVRYEVPAGAGALRVPPAVLQTLAENAIKHGIEPSAAGGEIHVSARRISGGWLLELGDTGAGLSGSLASAGGAGLANIAERLRLALGPAAVLTLESGATGGAAARIFVPVGGPAAALPPVPRQAAALAGDRPEPMR